MFITTEFYYILSLWLNLMCPHKFEPQPKGPELKSWAVPFDINAPIDHQIIINQEQTQTESGKLETTTFHVIHAYKDLVGRWTVDPSSERVYPVGFVKGDEGEVLSIEQQGDRLANVFRQSEDPMRDVLLLSNQVVL